MSSPLFFEAGENAGNAAVASTCKESVDDQELSTVETASLGIESSSNTPVIGEGVLRSSPYGSSLLDVTEDVEPVAEKRERTEDVLVDGALLPIPFAAQRQVDCGISIMQSAKADEYQVIRLPQGNFSPQKDRGYLPPRNDTSDEVSQINGRKEQAEGDRLSLTSFAERATTAATEGFLSQSQNAFQWEPARSFQPFDKSLSLLQVQYPAQANLYQSQEVQIGQPSYYTSEAVYPMVFQGSSGFQYQYQQQYSHPHQLQTEIPTLSFSQITQNLIKLPNQESKKVSPPVTKITSSPFRKRDRGGKPKRPLSAYNIFFKEERARMLEDVKLGSGHATPCDDSGRASTSSCTKDRPDEACTEREVTSDKTKLQRKRVRHGISFATMAKEIGKRWKDVRPGEMAEYRRRADRDKMRYNEEMAVFSRKQAETATATTPG